MTDDFRPLSASTVARAAASRRPALPAGALRPDAALAPVEPPDGLPGATPVMPVVETLDAAPDHYRTLHVLADAPAEVIKASWRTLHGRLRQHPDLGGSHDQALALNQAWAVLGDPERRAAYDRQRAPDPAAAQRQPSGQRPGYRCPLCQQDSAAPPRPDSRCGNCHSPLGRLPGNDRHGHELLGRRGAVRRDQSHVAMVHVGWPSPALPVRWRDLSLTGLSFYAPQPIRIGQRLRLIDSALEGVVEVVGCRAQGRVFTVHARLLTALLLQATGVFVSARA